ncbi:MAG: response regulator [Pseudomonadota bacterium]
MLIIDDDQDNRDLLAEFLAADGYPVVSCGTAAEANGVLDRRGCPSVVLSDIMLPDMRGTDFVEGMRTRPGFSATPVIFLTGVDARTLTDRPERILMKPYDLEELMALVSQEYQAATS